MRLEHSGLELIRTNGNGTFTTRARSGLIPRKRRPAGEPVLSESGTKPGLAASAESHGANTPDVDGLEVGAG